MGNKFTFLVGAFLLSLKLLLINTDPPKWDLSRYQPIDEPYYVYLAYNFFETGTLFGSDEPILTGNPFLTNLITYLSLETFGDNYLGLRFSSFFFSFIAYTFFVLLLQRIVKSRMLQIAAVLFFTLNFSFTTASLVVEPTIARMMVAMLVLWLVIKWKEKPGDDSRSLIWKSSLVCFLFLISYPTNAFLVGAAYISLVVIKNPQHLKIFTRGRIRVLSIESLYFAIGILISAFLYYCIIRILGGNIIEDILLATSTYGDRVAFDPMVIIMNWIKLMIGNFFRFNPLLLLLTVLSILAIIIKNKGKLNINIRIVIIFVACFGFQAAFLNDFPQRKLIILLPFLALIATYGLRIIWKEVTAMEASTSFWLIFISLIPVALLIYFERKYFSNQFIPLVTTVLGFFLLLIFIYKRTGKKIFSYTLFGLLLLPEVILLMDHYLLERTYYYENAYKSLKAYDGKNFIGGYSMGFRVYNKIIPHYNFYFYSNDLDNYWKSMDSLSKNGLQDYSIGYGNEKENFREIGFEPILVLMPADKTVYNMDWILYEEVRDK